MSEYLTRDELRAAAASARAHCQKPDACAAAKPTRHCRACANAHRNASPEMREASARNMAAKHQDPKFRKAVEKSQFKRTAKMKEAHKDPAWRARLESVAVVGRARSLATRRDLEWLPAEFRDEYRWLTKTHRIKAADARRMIEERIPGTAAHAALAVAKADFAGRLKHQRDLEQRY